MPTIPAALIHVSASIKGDPMIAELNAKVVGIAAKLKAKAVAADTAKMAPAAAPSGTQSVAERLATYSQGTVAAAEEEGYDPKNESTPFPGNGRAPERARGRDDRAPPAKADDIMRGDTEAVSAAGQQRYRALGIAADLRTEGTGSVIRRAVANPSDLAKLVKVYRDPRYETFCVFFMRGNRCRHCQREVH
ncbi:hypothetical protein O6027_13580 [Sphingomonas aerolata]|uniref:hypothetical protein n=1 Tax=Sphingomonas aerolata TaxID=185951 RepID=UPI00335E1349